MGQEKPEASRMFGVTYFLKVRNFNVGNFLCRDVISVNNLQELKIIISLCF